LAFDENIIVKPERTDKDLNIIIVTNTYAYA